MKEHHNKRMASKEKEKVHAQTQTLTFATTHAVPHVKSISSASFSFWNSGLPH